MKQTSRQILLASTSQVIGASETNTVVSEVLSIHNPSRILVDITASSTTIATGVTAKIQDSSDKSTWFTKGSAGNVAIAGDSTYSINLLDTVTGDQAELPLRPFVRVVITSGAGDEATIDSVMVAYEVE